MFDKFLSNKEIILQMKHFTRFYYQPFYVVLINLQVIYKKAAEIEFTALFYSVENYNIDINKRRTGIEDIF